MSDSFGPVILPENIVRDLLITQVNAGNYVFSMPLEGHAIGLDIFLNNQGAAAITLAIDGAPPITIPAGAAYGMTGVKWNLIAVVSAVNYDLQLAGVLWTTLKAKGIV